MADMVVRLVVTGGNAANMVVWFVVECGGCGPYCEKYARAVFGSVS